MEDYKLISVMCHNVLYNIVIDNLIYMLDGSRH